MIKDQEKLDIEKVEEISKPAYQYFIKRVENQLDIKSGVKASYFAEIVLTGAAVLSSNIIFFVEQVLKDSEVTKNMSFEILISYFMEQLNVQLRSKAREKLN